ncbi:MAG: hypothetical protein ACLPTM_04830 [Steroidobacteraceae bacterium]
MPDVARPLKSPLTCLVLLQDLALGVGGLASTYSFPSALNAAYGYRPSSWMLIVRARLARRACAAP